MVSPWRRMAASMALAAMVALGACTRESDEDTNEGGPAADGRLAVEVRITDDAIALPDTVPAGPTLFEVTNNGTTAHGFAIEGYAPQLEELAIDELDFLELELEPGTYVVYSPVDGDREAGLERQLTVSEAQSTDDAPLRDDAVGPSEQQDPIDDEP